MVSLVRFGVSVVSVVSFRCFGGSGGFGGFVSVVRVLVHAFLMWSWRIPVCSFVVLVTQVQ